LTSRPPGGIIGRIECYRASTGREEKTMGKKKKDFVPPRTRTSRAAMRYMREHPELYDGLVLDIDIWTPERMQATLERYGGKNRRTINRNIERLWSDMTSGRYKEDLRTKLVIDRDGNVIDGQHTLKAAIRAGKSLLLVTLMGVPSDVQDVIDQGAKRNAVCINEIKDGLEGKPKRKWSEITQIVKAMKAMEGDKAITETAVADFVRKHEKLLREIVTLSGTRDDPGHQSVKLAPVRAAFFSYALYRGQEGRTLVRRVMAKLRDVNFRRGDASKMLGAAVSPTYRTTNLSAAKSRKDLFPLAAAALLAEERGDQILSVSGLRKLAAKPATMVDFMKPSKRQA